jgi:hypothetical protein
MKETPRRSVHTLKPPLSLVGEGARQGRDKGAFAGKSTLVPPVGGGDANAYFMVLHLMCPPKSELVFLGMVPPTQGEAWGGRNTAK